MVVLSSALANAGLCASLSLISTTKFRTYSRSRATVRMRGRNHLHRVPAIGDVEDNADSMAQVYEILPKALRGDGLQSGGTGHEVGVAISKGPNRQELPLGAAYPDTVRLRHGADPPSLQERGHPVEFLLLRQGLLLLSHHHRRLHRLASDHAQKSHAFLADCRILRRFQFNCRRPHRLRCPPRRSGMCPGIFHSLF